MFYYSLLRVVQIFTGCCSLLCTQKQYKGTAQACALRKTKLVAKFLSKHLQKSYFFDTCQLSQTLLII